MSDPYRTAPSRNFSGGHVGHGLIEVASELRQADDAWDWSDTLLCVMIVAGILAAVFHLFGFELSIWSAVG